MHIFDYSFLDNGLLPAEIVNLTSAIAAFDGISNERKNNNKNIYINSGRTSLKECVNIDEVNW